MNYLKLVLIAIILIGCKKKSFADNIVLTNDHKIDMKFQEFNEGLDENSSSLIYVGKAKSSIALKYFRLDIPQPPQHYFLKNADEKNDSTIFRNLKDRFFNGDFNRIIYTDNEVKFDSLTKEKLEIIVKYRDTIPHFVIDSTRNIKAYKAFPVFVKNISDRKLKMVVDNFPGFAILNKNKKWQLIRNNNFYICGDTMYSHRYWVLEPNEIIVYAVNHFYGNQKARFKIGLTPTFFSEEFDGKINPKIIKEQTDLYLIK